MKKKISLIILILLMLTLLIGCGKKQEVSGHITEKIYKPKTTYVYFMRIWNGTTFTPIPMKGTNKEKHIFEIDDIHRIEVTKEIWERFNVGDYYSS